MATFVQGLASGTNLRPAANILSNMIMEGRQRKKDEEERLRQKQIQQSILDRLISGGESQLEERTAYGEPIAQPDTTQPFTLGSMLSRQEPSLSNPFPNKIEPRQQLTQTFRAHTPEEKTNLFMGLDNQTRDDYQKAQKMFQPKEPEYTQFLDTNKNIAFSKARNRWEDVRTGEQVDPTAYKKPEEPKYFKNRPYGYRKDESGQLVEDKNLPNREYELIEYKTNRRFEKSLGKWRESIDEYRNGKLYKPGAPRYIELTERKGGISYMSKDMQKVFDKYDQDRKKLEAQKEMLYQVGDKTERTEINPKTGEEEIIKDYQINDGEITATDLAKQIAQNRAEHISFIKKSAPPKFNDWYGKVYNHYKKDPETINEFTQEFLDAFRNGYFKKTVKIKNTKTGETRIQSDPGAEEFNYFREMSRALYGGYPETDELQDPSTEDVEIIEE